MGSLGVHQSTVAKKKFRNTILPIPMPKGRKDTSPINKEKGTWKNAQAEWERWDWPGHVTKCPPSRSPPTLRKGRQTLRTRQTASTTRISAQCGHRCFWGGVTAGPAWSSCVALTSITTLECPQHGRLSSRLVLAQRSLTTPGCLQSTPAKPRWANNMIRIPLLSMTSKSSRTSLDFQEKFRHAVLPLMSRPMISVGGGPDPGFTLHHQEN